MHHCAGSSRGKAMGGKIQNLVEAEGQKCKKMQLHLCVSKNLCIYSRAFPLHHRGKMTRTVPKKNVSLESLSR